MEDQASAKCLVPLDTFRSKFYSDRASGTRACFLLGSVALSTSEDVVPRRAITLTDDDRRVLANLALPPDHWSDLEVILARKRHDERVTITGQEISATGNELSCEYVLKKLGDFFRNAVDKDGAIIHYFGNARKLRGDWCFKDGFITFKDLMEVYMENYRGRILTIVSDCSYSGNWVKECYEFMDGQGVGPCGHYAIEKGILLKVFGSCKANETAATLGYSVRCVFFDKNTNATLHRVGWKIGEKQNSYGRDFTTMLCGKKVDEPCGVNVSATWRLKDEASRVHLVRGKDHGKPAWHYVLLVDDEDTIELFKETVKSGTVDVTNYGQVMESGWGKDPPNEVTDKIEKKYYLDK